MTLMNSRKEKQMLYLYTENDDGTVNYYSEGSYDVLLSYIKKHDLDDYALTKDTGCRYPFVFVMER